IYYMQGGGFAVTGPGSVTGSGVMIVNVPAGSNDTINLTGQGRVTLSPPTNLSGAWKPYNGIALFQDPASGAPISLSGRGGLTMTGVLYAPGALVQITGTGNLVVNSDAAHTLGAEVIVADVQVGGNGDFIINVSPPGGPAPGSLGGVSQAFTH